jgi:uncharacterized protein (DUF433 family)
MRPTEIVVTGRGPQLTDCKVTVYDVMPYWLAGRTDVYIAWALGITPDQVEALVRYMYDHHDEVMAVHNRIEERIARGNPPEVEEKMKQSEAKVRAWFIARGKPYPGEANGDGHPR